MSMQEILIRHLEHLAGLQLHAAERARFGTDLSRILTYVRQLDAVDTSSAAPGVEPGVADCPRRPDTPAPSLSDDEVLAAAPDRAGPFFVVPRVLPVATDEAGDV